MTPDKPEQRRDSRFGARGAIRVTRVSVSGRAIPAQEYAYTPCDISLRGVRLQLGFAVSVNERVQVEVRIEKDGRVFEHSGRVAWCRVTAGGGAGVPERYNAGIEFTTTPGPALNEWRIALLGLFE